MKTIPPPSESIVRNVDYLSVESAFANEVDPTALLELCRSNRVTGPLTFHLKEGGIREITLNQRSQIDDEQADTIRQLIGITNAK